MTVNPHDEAHPNHHEITVLLIRDKICTNKTSGYSTLGAAYRAEACNANLSCTICKDTGVVLGGNVAHEIGHLMGCRYDNGVDRDCTPMADVNAYVTSPCIQKANSSWPSCSRKSMHVLLKKRYRRLPAGRTPRSQLPITAMTHGAMYDAIFQ